MKITKIELKNFRGFSGEHTIDLGRKGRNLIVYGENGSGKSSLLKAIELFIDSHVRDIPFAQHRNRFRNDTDGGHVKITMRASERDHDHTYEWSDTTRNTDDPVIIDASKTKGSLDYKSLLEVYFLHPKDSEVDLFNLLIETILVNTKNNLTGNRFSDEWLSIKRTKVPRSNHTRKTLEFENLLDKFNNGLSSILNQLKVETLDILLRFGYPVILDFDFQGLTLGDIEGSSPKKCLNGNSVILRIKFLNIDFPQAHQFLNEAKLSAISLAIYLAALRINPSSNLKVLVLDDVLIGLDMSNRLPVINILKEIFADYQIFLMTYDKEWNEILKRHFPSWKAIELYVGHGTDYEMPIIVEKQMPIIVEHRKYLDKARSYLLANDHKAAAIYLRTAFEVKIKWFCEKMNIPIKYREKIKDLQTNDFWEPIKNARADNIPKYIHATLASDIELYRTFIMNPLSHAELVIAPTREIQNAIDTVERLENTLESIVNPPVAT